LFPIKEYQHQPYAKRGYSTGTIDYVAPNTAGDVATRISERPWRPETDDSTAPIGVGSGSPHRRLFLRQRDAPALATLGQ
jgi:hypothetical protein